MTFRINGMVTGDLLPRFVSGLQEALVGRGFQFDSHAGEERPVSGTGLVFNPFPAGAPRPYRRQAQSVFVIGITESETEPDDILKAAYPLLVRSLSNLLIYLVRLKKGVQICLVTLERGYFTIPCPDGDEPPFAEVLRRILPLATSRLVIDNIFETDLPEELWGGDECTRSISRAGRRLARLNLLPAPFPIQEILDARDYRHVQRLFNLGGLSYGNVSSRKNRDWFWMSASGIDKANMHQVGRDIQLVKGYDPARNAMLLSCPPHVSPRRVSVDAIEHWMIYQIHPDIGAILHVHAWMEDIPTTEINYPCGTIQLARSVGDLVRQAKDPCRAVIGLRNHGLTVTGYDLDEIFDRIEGRLLQQVPML